MKKYHFDVTIFFLLLYFLLMPRFCDAQEWNRKGKAEIFVSGQYIIGDTTSGLGLTLELDDAFAGGFGAGYNFNDYINLNTDLIFSYMDVTEVGFGVKTSADTTIFGWDLNLDFNLLKKHFSPLITGGIGLIKFSGEWTPDSKFRETDFSYNIGGGFRWNGMEHLLIKAICKATWTKLENTDNSVVLTAITFIIGYTF